MLAAGIQCPRKPLRNVFLWGKCELQTEPLLLNLLIRINAITICLFEEGNLSLHVRGDSASVYTAFLSALVEDQETMSVGWFPFLIETLKVIFSIMEQHRNIESSYRKNI